MAVTVPSGVAPAGSSDPEIAGRGVPLVLGATGAGIIDFNATPTTAGFDRRASHHPVSGTGNVTSILMADGRFVRATLTSAMTFVHQNGTLECPGDQNISGAIGDVVGFFKDIAGPVRIIEYMRANGTPVVAGETAVFMSPTGSDLNSGLTSASPVASAARALAIVGKVGEITMLPGDYKDPANPIVFDLQNTELIRIHAWAGLPVRVYHGERKTVFIQHSGPVYKVAVTNAIPADTNQPNRRAWVFEEGTPEGVITPANSHPAQKQRHVVVNADPTLSVAYRLSHHRLTRAASLAALIAGGPGAFFYQLDAGVPTVYFRRTDDADPNAVFASDATGIWLPWQVAGRSFVKNGNSHNRVEIEGIEVFFSHMSFDFLGCSTYALRSCLTYGSAETGVNGRQMNFGEEYGCEHAAHAADGVDSYGLAATSMTDQHCSKMLVYNTWAHDNGDQGISGHGGSEMFIYGGLLEENLNGGFLGFGQNACIGATTRNNGTAGFCILAYTAQGNITMLMQCVDCISDGDEYGYRANDQGQGAGTAKVIVQGGSISNATAGAFFADANTLIQHSGVMFRGNPAIEGGTGTVTNLSGAMTLGGIIGTVQALSGAGAVNTSTLTTALTSTGAAQALTLADGINGQIKTIVHDVDGGSSVLTPATKTGFTTITFTNVGETATLQFFTTRGWMVLSTFGAVAA